jgi:endoglucanase
MRRSVQCRFIAALFAVATGVAGISVGATPATAATFNYGEALQKSFLFYEAQMSGRMPAWNRVSWRADATLDDGASAGVDLSGGWYDAGDHVKFGFPMAAAVTTLAWGGVDRYPAYQESGQLTHLLNNLRWANDYFINAHPSPEVLYVQVGDGIADHNYWGAPETVSTRAMARPVYRITSSCPGTDIAAETASAMAASSLVFRPTDSAYADTLVRHAEQLFAFADSTKGTDGKDTAYVNCVAAAMNFYNSTNEGGSIPGATKMYWDELAYASIWLHRATGEDGYLDRAREFYPRMGTESGAEGGQVPVYSFGLGWNDKEYAVYEQMAELTGEQKYRDDVQRYLDYWTVGYQGRKGKVTPGGLAYIFNWGSLRMAMNTAWVAMQYAEFLGQQDPLYARYHDFARRQVDYVLGDNPRNGSYLVGFGSDFPRNPHHRGAHGSWTNGGPDGDPETNRHILYGAMVGGPGADDTWVDDRGDFINNEVAVDYNAGITSSLAGMYHEYGGDPLATLPVEVPDGPELSVEGKITTQGTGTVAQLFVTNRSAWPARVLDRGRLRYFFTLDGGTSAGQVTVTSPYSLCRAPSGPTQWSGDTYYVEVDCTGTLIYPGGQVEYRREVQLSIQSSGSWDSGNDPSALSMAGVALYDDGELVWGEEPS